ncbi:MAG TPA: Maf family protein [Phycisphaerae bacterium]|nr:Maf family protein [Phycisphaerae bacterium]
MLILASGSPRRAELLRRANMSFEVRVSPAEEPEHRPELIPTELWPACLAYMKAAAVQNTLRPSERGAIILAADTIVVHNHRILNKARDRRHARQILASLSGKTHDVITGICLMRGKDVRLSRAIATCRFRKLSPARLTAYLDTNLWKDKAGAYGIQDDHDPFVTLVAGDITTVIGLPVALVQSELASFPKE